MNEIRFELSWRTFWQILVFLFLISLIYLGRQALGILFTAIVISLGLDPIVSFLERLKIHRILGTVLIFLVAISVFSTAVYFIVPVLANETTRFVEDLNTVVSNLIGIGLPRDIIKDLGLTFDKALGLLTAAQTSITGAISVVLGKIIAIFATLVIAFYLSVEKEGPDRLLKVLMPDAYERPVVTIFNRFKTKIRRWLGAQLGLSLVIGVVVAVGLWLLGVRYAIILGLLAAILELVPIIGPVVAGIIAFLVALPDSLSLGLYVIGFFFLVQQLENNVLIPILLGKAMNVHPVIVFVALLAGAQVAGFVGIILSVPIAVLSQEIFTYLAERKDRRPSLV
ncbi:MAG TPA: AI-2E family transporter [Candidatus Paceibacterota bacterium]|nr:AI-2E family transporter [Candidatus Paceibacterota bacterium]